MMSCVSKTTCAAAGFLGGLRGAAMLLVVLHNAGLLNMHTRNLRDVCAPNPRCF